MSWTVHKVLPLKVTGNLAKQVFCKKKAKKKKAEVWWWSKISVNPTFDFFFLDTKKDSWQDKYWLVSSPIKFQTFHARLNFLKRQWQFHYSTAAPPPRCYPHGSVHSSPLFRKQIALKFLELHGWIQVISFGKMPCLLKFCLSDLLEFLF